MQGEGKCITAVGLGMVVNRQQNGMHGEGLWTPTVGLEMAVSWNIMRGEGVGYVCHQ